jgi:hypothetical protein
MYVLQGECISCLHISELMNVEAVLAGLEVGDLAGDVDRPRALEQQEYVESVEPKYNTVHLEYIGRQCLPPGRK